MSVFGNLPAWPDIDFSQFGEVERKALTRIEKLTAVTLARNWAAIPHVTHDDSADVTGVEALCEASKTRPDGRFSLLALAVKAAAHCLRLHPRFNASLAADEDQLILKPYFNIGVAVNSPRGLVVPVIRGADAKSVVEITAEIAELANLARGKGLPYEMMTGGCFTISSLGGFGGTRFNPIINAPEVAIMGLSRVADAAQPNGEGAVVWRRMLPLSLSYDHRVLNRADAAVFAREFAAILSNTSALPE
jgi:pyruvate dehydrogenase E2 component (dihydrolipoamide acetyltransferase)